MSRYCGFQRYKYMFISHVEAGKRECLGVVRRLDERIRIRCRREVPGTEGK